MNSQTIVVERLFNAPVSKVWKAITDVEEMRNWYFNLELFKAETGFKFQFLAGTDSKKYLHFCEVTEVIKERKLTYSWRYDGNPGNSFVTFELFEQGGKTLLRLTHEGVESFVSGGPDFAKTSFIGGWTYFIDTALPGYLEPVAQ